MFDLIKAIGVTFDSNSTLVGLLRKLYYTHPQSRAKQPYAVYDLDGDSPQQNTGKGYAQRVRATFRIYGQMATDLKAPAEALRAAFFQKQPTLDNGKIIQADLESESVVDLESDDANEPRVYYELVISYFQTQTRA